MERVVLVDGNDVEIGVMEKIEAHQKGLLHRAFSVFIFNNKGEMLLQQRSLKKYHSGGLWTNACCSHPKPFETTISAAHRRLQEEMGFEVKLVKAFDFTYKAAFLNGLTEHEYDHVFMGITDELPLPDPAEVASFRYMDNVLLGFEISENPDEFTAWFKICLEKVLEIYYQIV